MNIEEYLKLLDELVNRHTQEHLTDLQKAVIQGALAGLTYEKMSEELSTARYYTVEYISRNIAPDLWKLLTKVLRKAQIIDKEENVNKKNLGQYLDKVRSLSKIIKERYQIIHPLDSRGLIKTYLAQDLSNKFLCVVKRVENESHSSLYRFTRAAKILHCLGKHEQIPELFDSFTENKYFYLISQFIEGKFISEELKENQPWEEYKVIILLRDILEILDFIHQQNVIHRYINPDNLIRRTSDNKIILVNFETVTQINKDPIIPISIIIPDARGYTAPELAIGRSQFSSDIYAVGIIGIQAITGLPIRKLRLDQEKDQFIWSEKIKVSQAFAQVLNKMVSYDYRERYQSAREVLQALENLQ